MVNFPTEEDLDDGEECYEYKLFADENKKKLLVTFYRSYTGTNVSFTQALDVYDWLPPVLKKNCEEIVLSNQESGKSAGYVRPDEYHKIILLNRTTSKNIKNSLTHEMAHCFDFSNEYISNSKGYMRVLNNDLDGLYGGDFSNLTPDYFITEQAFEDYIGFGGHDNAPNAEDFADSVEMFLITPGLFRWRYINKANYLSELLDK